MVGKKGMKKGGAKNVKRPMKSMQGEGFMDVVKKVGSVLSPVNKFLKDTKILSSAVSLIPPTAPYVGQVAQVGAPILKSLGYGQMGRGVIKGPNNYIISTPEGGISTPSGYYNILVPNVKPVGVNQIQSGQGRKKKVIKL